MTGRTNARVLFVREETAYEVDCKQRLSFSYFPAPLLASSLIAYWFIRLRAPIAIHLLNNLLQFLESSSSYEWTQIRDLPDCCLSLLLLVYLLLRRHLERAATTRSQRFKAVGNRRHTSGRQIMWYLESNQTNSTLTQISRSESNLVNRGDWNMDIYLALTRSKRIVHLYHQNMSHLKDALHHRSLFIDLNF